ASPAARRSSATRLAAWKRRRPATISKLSGPPPSAPLGTGLGRTRIGWMTPRARIVGNKSDTSGAFLPWRILALLTDSLSKGRKSSFIGLAPCEGRSVLSLLGGRTGLGLAAN